MNRADVPCRKKPSFQGGKGRRANMNNEKKIMFKIRTIRIGNIGDKKEMSNCVLARIYCRN